MDFKWSFSETKEKQIKPQIYLKFASCSRVHKNGEDL